VSTILISGASSAFGAMTARHLHDAGHTVFAGMRAIADRNAEAARAATEYGYTPVELDVSDQASVDAGVASIGAIDVLVHNAGHMVLGPAEAFSVEQIAEIYDTNVLSTQRLNRAVLPQMRARRDGLLVWVGSTSTRGGTPPYLAPYFAAKAAEDSLAVSYAAELARFGIETTIIVPGSFTHGTNHFAHAGHASDTEVAGEYDAVLPNLLDEVGARLAELAPDDADPEEVARAIVRVVGAEKGTRPFRVHIDPADDGAELVNAVGDRIRREFYGRIGLTDLLGPAVAPR
jgi:NAD(P)-dependent dehydrogenase (short-subunit alcohol dehydrogenase family)